MFAPGTIVDFEGQKLRVFKQLRVSIDGAAINSDTYCRHCFAHTKANLCTKLRDIHACGNSQNGIVFVPEEHVEQAIVERVAERMNHPPPIQPKGTP